MKFRSWKSRLPGLCVLAALAMANTKWQVPRSWTDQELVGFRLPLAGLNKPPVMVPEQEYYALPENNLKTYPVYTPDKEPPNYLDWLKQQDPKPLVEVDKLKTQADWIAAGTEVFFGRELPRFSGSEDNLQLIRNPKILAAYRVQTTADGVLLGLRYIVREKGKLELGTDTCAMLPRPDLRWQTIPGFAKQLHAFRPSDGRLDQTLRANQSAAFGDPSAHAHAGGLSRSVSEGRPEPRHV